MVAASFDCRVNKRNTVAALEFEQYLEPNLFDLHRALVERTYRPGSSICFVVTYPKAREVWAAPYPDRVVHHLLYNAIGPRFEASFIADSCACIPGRGTLYAAERLEAKIRSATQNWSRPVFYLKCDLANFFVSIPKSKVGEILARKLDDPKWRWLAETILFHDPRPDVTLQAKPSKLALIPPHKSLFNQDADHGLPIGNLSSQFFANVFLNELDQFVKHRLGVRQYVRYVDDFILLHESPKQLNAWLAEIAAFLPSCLGVRLNPAKTILQPVDRGVDFVGHVVKPWSRRTRRRTFNEALRRMDEARDSELFERANSYFGLFRQCPQSHHDRAHLANKLRRRGWSVDRALTKIFRKGEK